jgi:hypothetical protein
LIKIKWKVRFIIEFFNFSNRNASYFKINLIFQKLFYNYLMTIQIILRFDCVIIFFQREIFCLKINIFEIVIIKAL